MYALTYFNADPSKIKPMERDAQLSERILRLLVLRADGVTQERMDFFAPPPKEEEPEPTEEAPPEAEPVSEPTEEVAPEPEPAPPERPEGEAEREPQPAIGAVEADDDLSDDTDANI